MDVDVRLTQPVDERDIEPRETLAVIKIVEAQPVSERKGGHLGDIQRG
jgi:hypothetical protein